MLAHALLTPLAAAHLIALGAAGIGTRELVDGLVRHAELVVGTPQP